MKLTNILAAALLAFAPAMASATTVGFTYAGVDDDDSYVTSAGSGTISFNGSGALTLANLTGFSFSQTTTLSDPALSGAGTFTYGLGDVLAFAGVFNGSTFSSLSLRTRTVADPSGFLADQSFRIRSLNANGANAAFDDGGTDEATVGAVLVTAAVPEPASWTLMIMGVGIAGAAARGRRRPAVRASFA